MEQATVAVYEARAAEWHAQRPGTNRAAAAALDARRLPGLPLVDLGSGTGAYLRDLGRPTVALDAASAMLAIGREGAPDVPAVQADLESIPFRRASVGAAWARASYLHLPRSHLPLALAGLHHCLAVGAPVHLDMRAGDDEGELAGDDFPGRFFAHWNEADLTDAVTGAGFVVEPPTRNDEWIGIDAVTDRTLPDFVGPGLRVLVCGLNPSLTAADAGFGFAGPSNRFWKAATAAGLVSTRRDPWSALRRDRVGMTDMVKRATPRSSLLTRADYRQGAARVERLVAWLRPRIVLFVGLEGWRAAVDRTATAGLQATAFGGAPAYVMPSTSGLNASSSLDDLVEHMRQALQHAG